MASEKHKLTEDHLIGCLDCRNNIPFELPQPILNACLEGKLVIFAGAGISTEGRNVFPFTLYDDLKAELNIKSEIPFPTLMTRFVEKHMISVYYSRELNRGSIMPNLFQTSISGWSNSIASFPRYIK